MPKQTRLMKITFPSENEEPFIASFEAGMNEHDAIHYASAENGNLIWFSDGSVSWNAGTDTLTWSDDIKITGMTTGPYFATISAGGVDLQEGEVAFFEMPRQLKADVIVGVNRAGRIFSVDTRLNNLRLFAVRIGDSVLFGNGTSLADGQAGPIFGGGLPAGGGTLTEVQVGPAGGIVVTNGLGPVVDVEADFAGSGGTLGVASTVARSDHSHAGVTHTHEPQLRIAPGAGVISLNLNADALIGAKTLIWASVYRNGSRLSDPDHLAINLGLKTASLAFTTLATDLFIIDRVTT